MKTSARHKLRLAALILAIGSCTINMAAAQVVDYDALVQEIGRASCRERV